MKLGLIMVLMLSLILIGCTESQEPTPTSPDQVSLLEYEDLHSTYVEWYGRHHYQNESEYFYHTATGMKIRFYGRVFQIELGLEQKVQDIYYSIGKDGEELLDAEVYVQTTNQTTFTIEFDTYDFHTIEIVKRSEPQDGITSVTKISTNGYFIESEIDEIKPHFLIIGASGISGHGALGTQGQPRTTANSSSLHAFGYLTAAHFEGTYEFIANSGWGLAFGYNDPSGEENIAKAYDVVGIDSAEHLVSTPYTSSLVPDYIIINIGGNDYSAVINKLTSFDKTEKIIEFKEAVANFILTLREDAPEAHIFWTMTEGSLNGTAASQVIAQLPVSDQAYVHIVVIKQVGEDGDPIGANNHASYITHQKSAQILIDQILLLQQQTS
jgi:hypothetical protein